MNRKENMRYILVIPVLIICLGCKHSKKVLTKYQNGQSEIVLYYDNPNDTLTYHKKCYYPSGKLEYTGDVIEDKKEGVWTWWYENGNKKDECKFLKGIEIDTIFHWYENGNFKRVDILHKGRIDPKADCSVCCNMTSKIYYDNGKLKETLTIEDNAIEDTNRLWFSNGQLESIIVFKNGTQNGLSEQYYSNGQIKRYAIYVDDWEEGKVMEWDSTGKMTYEKYWKNKKEIK